MGEFDEKYNIINDVTPLNTTLTAHYKKSFAYYTIRERLPVILTRIVDQLARDKELIASNESKDGATEIKEVQGNISKLKYELQTDKPFLLFDDDVPDKDNWNDFLSKLDKDKSSYFTSTWLSAECYMYRRLKSIFVKSTFHDFDYFRQQKEIALTSSYDSIISVIEQSNKLQQLQATDDEFNNLLAKLIKLNLWGNRCDLSISCGREVETVSDPFAVLESLDSYILVNKINEIVKCLKDGNENVIIDCVLDNSGYELFTDLLLGKFIIENKLAKQIRFHVKAIPWFISDVMDYDFKWTIDAFKNHENELLGTFGKKLSDLLKNDQMVIRPAEFFWTGAYDYDSMESVNKSLYNLLKEAHLVIFKGDLNYRKLLGDFNWPYNSTFETVLKRFRPTNVCALRTIKADLVCELEEGIVEELSKTDPMWMETGKFGVIHFASKKN